MSDRKIIKFPHCGRVALLKSSVILLRCQYHEVKINFDATKCAQISVANFNNFVTKWKIFANELEISKIDILIHVDIFDFKQRDKIAIDCDVKRKRIFFCDSTNYLSFSYFPLRYLKKAVLPDEKL